MSGRLTRKLKEKKKGFWYVVKDNCPRASNSGNLCYDTIPTVVNKLGVIEDILERHNIKSAEELNTALSCCGSIGYKA